MKNKTAQTNKRGAETILSKLAQVRSQCGDIAAKRRLRAAEETLSLSAPVTETDVSFLDDDILRMLGEFLTVASEGILTERYLDRIDELLARRRTMD